MLGRYVGKVADISTRREPPPVPRRCAAPLPPSPARTTARDTPRPTLGHMAGDAPCPIG